MSLANIRTKIDEALGTIEGLGHSDRVPAVVNPPFAFPALRPQEPVTYDLSVQNASLVYHFYIEILVNKGASLELAQDELDPYLHSKDSVKEAIESIDWGDDADCCRVMNVMNYGPAIYGGVEFLAARLALDIWISD